MSTEGFADDGTTDTFIFSDLSLNSSSHWDWGHAKATMAVAFVVTLYD